MLQQEGARTSNRLPCPLRRAELVLTWGQGREVSRNQDGGVAWVFCPPRRGVVCRGHSAFAPGSSEVAVGLLGLFVSHCPAFAPTTHACIYKYFQSLGGSDGKVSACNADRGLIPGAGRSPGEGNDNPLQLLACRIPRTEEPGGLQSMGSQSCT